MTDQVEIFRKLHVPGNPLILVNIWDAGSAKVVAGAGAKALATGSYGVAEALGQKDGEDLLLADALANLARIKGVTNVPVSIDMEAGYGDDPAGVGSSTIARSGGGDGEQFGGSR
jgi:2-methylisocitrate lyase-like PEP mutase family enzyme